MAMSHPDYPALALDTPAKAFAAIPEIAADSFVVRMRGFGNKIAEISAQWFDSIPSAPYGEKLILNPEGTPNEALFRKVVYFPTFLNLNFKLRIGIKNQTGRAVYYWLSVRRKRA
jgi:hypothetical protein